MSSQSLFTQAQGASPRVAIVHDWLTTPGGAERVLWRLCSILPNADLFTLIDDGKTLPDQREQPVPTSTAGRLRAKDAEDEYNGDDR